MKYAEKSLKENEKIIKKAKLNPIIRLPYLIITIISFIITFNIDVSEYQPSFIFFFILSVVMLVQTIRICIILDTTELCFTNSRVIGKVGWLNTITLDSPINKINDIMIIQSLMGKLLNYSTIKICTSSSNYYFKYIENSEEFKNALTDFINKSKTKENVKTNDKYGEMLKLKELLDKQIITKDEFEKEKAKLLNQ